MSKRQDIGLVEGSPTLYWPYHEAVAANRRVLVFGQIGATAVPGSGDS